MVEHSCHQKFLLLAAGHRNPIFIYSLCHLCMNSFRITDYFVIKPCFFQTVFYLI